MGGVSGVGGAVAVLGACVTLLAACALVGAALRILLKPAVPHSLGVTAGLGAATSAVAVALSYRFFSITTAAVAALLVAAALVCLAAALIRIRRSGPRVLMRSAAAALGGRTELVAVGLVLLVLAPVIAVGPTWWSLGSNDIHRYVGSVQLWTSGEDGARDLTSVLTGPTLDGHVQRATSEKPMATALLATASITGGLPAYRAVTPLMATLLLVSVSSSLALLVRRWRLPLLASACAAAATTLSVVPMVRLLEAQPGQVAAVALLALGLVVAARPSPQAWRTALVLGVVLAAATGANPSLVAGVAPLWLAAAVWAASRSGTAVRAAARPLAVAAMVAAVLVAAFVPWFVRSWRLQGGGSEGHDVPFVSPLALVGLQPGTDPRLPSWTAWVLWLVVLAVGAVVVARRRPALRGHGPAVAVAAVAAASLLGLVGVYGPDNYVVHKWIAAAIALVMPLALAPALAVIGGSERLSPFARLAVPVGIAAAALSFSSATAASLPHVGSDDLLALADDPRLAALPALDVDVDDLLERSMLPLVVPSRTVSVVRTTYDAAAAPSDAPSLVRRDQLGTGRWTDVVLLDSTYALATRDVVTTLPTAVTASVVDSQRLLGGDWYVVGDDLRTTSPTAWFVARVDSEPVGLMLTLQGLTSPVPTTLDLGSGGVSLGSAALAPGRPTDLVVRIPAGAMVDGRVEVSLTTPAPQRGSDVALAGFSVTSIRLEPTS